MVLLLGCDVAALEYQTLIPPTPQQVVIYGVIDPSLQIEINRVANTVQPVGWQQNTKIAIQSRRPVGLREIHLTVEEALKLESLVGDPAAQPKYAPLVVALADASIFRRRAN